MRVILPAAPHLTSAPLVSVLVSALTAKVQSLASMDDDGEAVASDGVVCGIRDWGFELPTLTGPLYPQGDSFPMAFVKQWKVLLELDEVFVHGTPAGQTASEVPVLSASKPFFKCELAVQVRASTGADCTAKTLNSPPQGQAVGDISAVSCGTPAGFELPAQYHQHADAHPGPLGLQAQEKLELKASMAQVDVLTDMRAWAQLMKAASVFSAQSCPPELTSAVDKRVWYIFRRVAGPVSATARVEELEDALGNDAPLKKILKEKTVTSLADMLARLGGHKAAHSSEINSAQLLLCVFPGCLRARISDALGPGPTTKVSEFRKHLGGNSLIRYIIDRTHCRRPSNSHSEIRMALISLRGRQTNRARVGLQATQMEERAGPLGLRTCWQPPRSPAWTTPTICLSRFAFGTWSAAGSRPQSRLRPQRL